MMATRMKNLILGISLGLLAGCSAAPTRQDVEEFESLMTGSIPPSSVLDFASCLHDGFSQSHAILSDIDTKQQMRSDGYRVETFAGGRILVISADVLNNGHVELWESSAAALINTSGEREAFKLCLDEYMKE